MYSYGNFIPEKAKIVTHNWDQVAEVLNLDKKLLLRRLRALNVIDRNNVAAEAHVQSGYFIIREKQKEDESSYQYTLTTESGLEYLKIIRAIIIPK